MAQRFAGKVNAPDFPSDAEWLNTRRPLALRDLRGKLDHVEPLLARRWRECRTVAPD